MKGVMVLQIIIPLKTYVLFTYRITQTKLNESWLTFKNRLVYNTGVVV